MIFIVYDGSGKERFSSENWPMARAALDVVIQEGCGIYCPRLVILPKDEK